MKPKPIYNSNIASTYEADRKNEEHWAREDVFIRNHFESKQLPVLLDLPVGTGRFFEHYPKECAVWGVDISPDMLEQARKRLTNLGKTARLDIGDATDLHFIADNSIDSIVCCRLFHLVDDVVRAKILNEFVRILRGELVLQAYLCGPPKSIVTRAMAKIRSIATSAAPSREDATEKRPWSHIQSYPLTETRLLELLAAAQFKSIEKTYLCDYLGEDVAMFIVKK